MYFLQAKIKLKSRFNTLPSGLVRYYLLTALRILPVDVFLVFFSLFTCLLVALRGFAKLTKIQ